VLPWQLEDENRRLRLMNDQREATNASLTRHIDSLTSEVDLLRHAGSHDGRAMATVARDDHVQFLTEQATQFRADFESEKRDRIAAEALSSELRQQLAAASSQVTYFQHFPTDTYLRLRMTDRNHGYITSGEN